MAASEHTYLAFASKHTLLIHVTLSVLFVVAGILRVEHASFLHIPCFFIQVPQRPASASTGRKQWHRVAGMLMQLAPPKMLAMQLLMVELCPRQARVGARGTSPLTMGRMVPGAQHAQHEREQKAESPASVVARQ